MNAVKSYEKKIFGHLFNNYLHNIIPFNVPLQATVYIFRHKTG